MAQSSQTITQGEIIIYKSHHGPEIQVTLKKDTVWLDAHLIAKVFNVNRPAIVKHINNIYKSGELSKKSTCSILEQVAADGKIRKRKNIFEECGADPRAKTPIEEQEPKPLPDRAELDKIVFDALDLTVDERKDVYRAVCRLVWNRISKARSM